MKFEAGNIVRHKAGGPKMVIRSIKADGRCFCSWYSQFNDKFDSKDFQPEELKLEKK